jgi:hypothetical protein
VSPAKQLAVRVRRENEACARYELPAGNLENLYSIFSGIQKALLQGDIRSAQDLCAAGQKQLRDVVICFD